MFQLDEPLPTGREIASMCNQYLQTGSDDLRRAIIRHNEADLLRELYLLVHYPLL